jgi:hypothetical protein
MAHYGVPEHLRSTMGLSSSLPAWSTDWKPRGSRRFASSPLLMKLEMADGSHEDTAQDPKPEPPPTSTVQADLRRVPGRGRGRRPLSTILRASLAFGDGRLSPAGARQWSAKGQNAPGPNAKNAKRALPAARRCCKKPLQVGRKPVSAPNQAWKVTFRTGTQKPNSYPYSWTRYGVGSDYWCSDRVENPLWSNALR